MAPSMEFPFPPEKKDTRRSNSLPAFPEASGTNSGTSAGNSLGSSVLSPDEVRKVRILLGLFRLDGSNEAPSSAPGTAPATPTLFGGGATRTPLTQEVGRSSELAGAPPSPPPPPPPPRMLDILKPRVEHGIELATFDTLKAFIDDVTDESQRNRFECAMLGLMPLQKHLRHGTPEQKLAVLSMVTDRFLKSVAGLKSNHRKDILQTVAAYVSGLSGTYTFLQGEGEPFNNQYYERAEGSDVTGKHIREVHSYLVIKNETRLVARLGQALT